MSARSPRPRAGWTGTQDPSTPHVHPARGGGRRPLPRLRSRRPSSPSRRSASTRPCDASKEQLFALRDHLGDQPQRHRAGDLPRRGQQRDGRRRRRPRTAGPAASRPSGRTSPTPSCAGSTRQACGGCGSTSSNAWSTPPPRTTWPTIAKKIAPLGWHVVIYFEAADLADLEGFFAALPDPAGGGPHGPPRRDPGPSTARSSAASCGSSSATTCGSRSAARNG